MQLTGNPFVDTGLMVIAALADRSTVDDLTFKDIRSIYGDGALLARQNQHLKSYTMVFGTNGPLTQPAYKKAKKNEAVYIGTLSKLLDHAEHEGTEGDPCDLTGIRTDLNFHKICSVALADAGLSVPDQKWIGRDWVPLGGSLGNDAQALPGASRPLHVSALAMFALQYLPLGLLLFRGKLACAQSTDSELPQNLVNAVVEKNRNSLDKEILGKGGGSGVILNFLLGLFEDLRSRQRDWSLPENTQLLLWLFSNSGTGADCAIEPIPDSALRFISEASEKHSAEIRSLVKNDPKDPRLQLFECVRTGRDYPGLYPFKKIRGVSPAFYDFYQQQVRGIEPGALSVARKLASIVVVESSEKQKQEIRKPEFLKSATGRNRIRRAIVDHLSIAEYDTLFPSVRNPISVSSLGWDLMRFYLGQSGAAGELGSIETMKTTHPKIIQIGDAYFAARGPRKISNTLAQLAQRKLGVRWLQDVFCHMAENPKFADFNLGTWDEFACDQEGTPIVFELLFQMRLYLANKYRESLLTQKEMTA